MVAPLLAGNNQCLQVRQIPVKILIYSLYPRKQKSSLEKGFRFCEKDKTD